ncbi:unnamed protein product [Trichogramma brassicae]|uniref:Reverse transcriptase domain-containing protein n=1 Tax=Trichogramma brassicae TaxID=86971 RepID=A0A6H5J008_9HYME|nr:unnamed protein product [Trichogramma brassicae]
MPEQKVEFENIHVIADEHITDDEQELSLFEIDTKVQATEADDKFKTQLKNLCIKHRSCFRKTPGRFKSYEHTIIMKNDEPFFMKSYPIPDKYRDKVSEEIDNMLRYGVIERAVTPYINPLVIVPKKNGAVRICLDARQINDRMQEDHDGPEEIDQVLRRCQGIGVMSSLDLRASFWQVPLAHESRKYTGFSHQGYTYQYTSVPFGLKISSAALNRAAETILRDMRDSVIAFVDDWLVVSATMEQHLQDLDELLTVYQTRTSDQEKTPSVSSTATVFVLHGARHDAVSKRSGSLVQASTGRKRKAWDDVGQDPMREESRKLICQWVEDVNHATKIGRRSDNRKPLAARENTQPLVCTVQPRCVQRPASPTPSIVSARPASTIDLISGDEDDEPIIVCEIFHARRPTALPPVQRPTTPQRIRPASVLIIESPASPPISPATSPSLSLESRPPSPVRFSPTPPLSYSPISSALENYSSHEDDGASPRPSPSYSPVQSASESDNTPPGSPQFINPAWVPNEQDSDDEEIDHEVALIWGQRAFQAAADEGYFSAQSSSKHLDAFITRVLAQASERALSETPTTPTVARAPPVPSQPYAGPVRKRDRKRKFAPFFAASIEITRMRRRRCMERVSSVWRGQSPAGIKDAQRQNTGCSPKRCSNTLWYDSIKVCVRVWTPNTGKFSDLTFRNQKFRE